MGFTKITQTIKNSFGTVSVIPESSYYHLEDLEELWKQPGAINGKYETRTAIVDGENCIVALAVNDLDEDGVLTAIDKVNNLAGLPCPPFRDKKGGKLFTF